MKGMSLRKAIDMKCKDCIYDDGGSAGGTWRQQVEACTSPNCPLFAVRPKSKPEKALGSTGKQPIWLAKKPKTEDISPLPMG